MTEFHKGTKIVKSTHTVFSIPPKRKPREYKAQTSNTPRLTKVQQAARELETPEERNARLTAKVLAFNSKSVASYPSATPQAKEQDKVKTAKLVGRL